MAHDFHLRSAHQILSTLFPDEPEFLTAVDELLLRLEFGLPTAAIPLTALPLALSRGQYLALFAAGCSTADEVNELGMDALTECVGANVASLLRPEQQD